MGNLLPQLWKLFPKSRCTGKQDFVEILYIRGLEEGQRKKREVEKGKLVMLP